MRKLSFEEIKEKELEILIYFADFCERNNLQYFLAYGTLIGAVRHKGFIPWDDDIDVWMPKADYDRLLEIFNKEQTKYKAISPYDKIARHSFVKIIDTTTRKIEAATDYSKGFLGIDIDVFPLEGQPTHQEEYTKWYNDLQKIYTKHRIHITPHSFRGKIYQFYVALFYGTKKQLLKKADRMHSKYRYENSEYVGTTTSCYNSIKNRFEKKWFAESVELDFEGLKFKAPKNYHEILTIMYGDYMTPPKKQQTHHENEVYAKE